MADGLVVPAPNDDRGMVAQKVDGLARHAHGLAPDAGRIPLQRQVLPDEQPELVGGVVELGRLTWACTRTRSSPASRARDVAPELLGGGRGQCQPGGVEVGALEEQPLAVDGQHPVAQRHLTEAGPHEAGVADFVLDVDADGHGRQA